MHRNNEKLRTLMKDNALRRRDVCRMLGKKVFPRSCSNGTLDNWLAGRHRCPNLVISHLELQLQQTGHFDLRVEEPLRKSFIHACRKIRRPPSEVLREFMVRFVLERESAEQPDLFT